MCLMSIRNSSIQLPMCDAQLCADDLTCFEPESNGMLVGGLEFHRYYFDLASKMPKPSFRQNITMSNPHIRWVGKDCAVVSYTRVDQIVRDNVPVTKTFGKSETEH